MHMGLRLCVTYVRLLGDLLVLVALVRVRVRVVGLFEFRESRELVEINVTQIGAFPLFSSRSNPQSNAHVNTGYSGF